MERIEAEALLTFVSALDQRKISDDVIEMWAHMLSGTDPVFAREAVEEHFKTKPDTYLNIGHVIAGARRAALRAGESSASLQRELEEADWVGDPQPVCEAHDRRILDCDDCCSLIFHQAGYMDPDSRHSWAMAHVYRPREAWA